MIEPTTSSQVTEHRSRWKWFLALGAILLVLGIAGVSVASLLQLTSLLVFGPLLLASSLLQFLTAFFAENQKERLPHFVAAGLEMVLGFFIMANPPERVVGFITLVAIFLIVIGLARLARSLATQSRGRAWTFFTGVIALLLGISVWIGGSAAKLGFVGLCIAVDFLCHGVSWSALALAEKKPVQAPVS
jgi:membrane protein HdeD